MTERASAVPARIAPSRRMTTAALAFLAVALLLVGMAGAPYLFKFATLQSEVESQVRATTGLVLSSNGHARFDLLPSPRVAMTGLHFADPSGTLAIDADAFEGEVRLLPLVVGRLELSSATLIRPKLAIDLDGDAMAPDSMIGRALRGGGPPPSAEGEKLGVVTLVDGTAVVNRGAIRRTPKFDAINVTLDWPDLDAPATLTGSLQVQNTAADVTAWIAQPSNLMRGDASPIALRVRSAPLDLSANGDFRTADTSSFRGHVFLTAPSLPLLFALAGTEITPPAPFANITLTSDVTIGVDRERHATLDLPSLHLAIDGNAYEGTLAFLGGAKPILSGTLATEQLSLAPFLSRVPKLTDGRQWARLTVPLGHDDRIALDLRVSATHLRIAPFTIDDAALAIMTRGDRTEAALVEGKAYGGDIKARVSVGASGDSLNLRGAGSLVDADAATLSWDAFGRQLATGTVSGSANIETFGETPAALMTHLRGSAKGHVADGELSGVDIGRGLREIDGKRNETGPLVFRPGRTPFQTLGFALRLADGVATIDEASMEGADSTVVVTGNADIGGRRLDLHAVAATPQGAGGAAKGAPSRGADIKGPFDRVTVMPGADDTPRAGKIPQRADPDQKRR